MRRLILSGLIIILILALAGVAGAVAGFSLRSDGWYAPSKVPIAVLDYSVLWRDWLRSDTILTSNWEYSTGITIGLTDINQDPVILDDGTTAPPLTLVTIWLLGGTAGQKYNITNTITTAAGRINLVSFKIEVK